VILRPPFDRADMPTKIARLEVDKRGYPIPWFVDRAAPPKDGGPDFRVMDGDRLKRAIREKRCWICGLPLQGEAVFVIGPMCAVNRTNAEPPNHSGCAEWAVKACPFLAVPKRVRDERELPSSYTQAGTGIRRNPGVAGLWFGGGTKTFHPPGGGVLFELGEPNAVFWYCEGRRATRAEVVESVDTGLPLLMAEAAKEGAEALFDLGRMTERFMPLLPKKGEADG
jgi:hypothetical protein